MYDTPIQNLSRKYCHIKHNKHHPIGFFPIFKTNIRRRETHDWFPCSASYLFVIFRLPFLEIIEPRYFLIIYVHFLNNLYSHFLKMSKQVHVSQLSHFLSGTPSYLWQEMFFFTVSFQLLLIKYFLFQSCCLDFVAKSDEIWYWLIRLTVKMEIIAMGRVYIVTYLRYQIPEVEGKLLIHPRI